MGGHDIYLPSNSNVSKKVRINVTSLSMFLKEYSIGFLMMARFIDFVLAVLRLLMFKIYGNFGISKIKVLRYSGFAGLNGLGKINKQKKIIQS